MTYLFYVSGSNVLQDFFIYNGEPVGVVVPPNLIGKYKKKNSIQIIIQVHGEKKQIRTNQKNYERTHTEI